MTVGSSSSLSRPAAGLGGASNDQLILASLILAGALFYLVPNTALSIAVLGLVALGTWARPVYGLALTIFFLPYFMEPKSIGSLQFPPAEIFLLLTAAVVAAQVALGRRLQPVALVRSPYFLPGLLFVVASIVATLAAAELHLALRYWRWTVLEPLIFYGLILSLEPDERQWRLLLGTVVAAGLVVSLIGLWQFGTHQDLSTVPGSTLERIPSVYGSPDNLGLMLDRAIPIWLAACLFPPAAPRSRLLLWLAGLPLLVALFLTYSRGAWVAVAVATFALVALRFRLGRLGALIGVAIIAGAGVAVGPTLYHVFSAGHGQTVERRVYIWRSAAHMVRDHPVLGIGPDNFQHYYAPSHFRWGPKALGCSYGLNYIDNAHASQEPCLSHPHNEFLDFWLSTGILGLLAFIWLEVAFWRASLRLWRRTRGDPLLLGVMGAMLATLVHGLVDNSYFLPDLAMLFWLLLAYIAWRVFSQRLTPLPGPERRSR